MTVAGMTAAALGTAVAPVTADARPGYIFLDWTEAASRVSTDASYTFTSATRRSLVARFAALPSLQMNAPAPATLRIAWPDGASDWVLEESADLMTWSASTRTITVNGSQKQVIITPPAGKGFFRLTHP